MSAIKDFIYAIGGFVKQIVFAIGGFVHDNAGRLLVLAVFLLLVFYAHHAAGIQSEADFEQFCISKAGEAFAAFLGLITGAALTQQKPNTTVVSSTSTTTEAPK